MVKQIEPGAAPIGVLPEVFELDAGDPGCAGGNRAVVDPVGVRRDRRVGDLVDGADVAGRVRRTLDSVGLYLIIQAALSFGVGGYIAGRTSVAPAVSDADEIEHRDGLHGLAAWALAVVLGVALAALLGSASLTRSNSNISSARTSAAEPLLSYEIDRLFRPLRRAANVDLSQERAEAGQILLTSSSHSGMSSEDRSYLAQLVAANTGLAGPEAEKRVDGVIANSRAAIAKSRRSSVILAFSVAAALLLGAVIAWASAGIGGRHRDGAPMPHWMGARGSGVAYRREAA